MNGMNVISGAALLSLAGVAAGLPGLAGPERDCEQGTAKARLSGAFSAPLVSESGPGDRRTLVETLGGRSFADLGSQPEKKVRVKKRAGGDYKVYVKVVGPDGQVREFNFGGDGDAEHGHGVDVIVESDGDGKRIVQKRVEIRGEPHSFRWHDGGEHEVEGRRIIIGPEGKGKIFRFGPEDFDFDFDFDMEFDDASAAMRYFDREALETKIRAQVEEAMKSAGESAHGAREIIERIRVHGAHKEHVQKLHEHLKKFEGKARFFGDEDFDFEIDLEGVPDAEEIKKIIERAREGATRWHKSPGSGVFFFDDGQEGHEHGHDDTEVHSMSFPLEVTWRGDGFAGQPEKKVEAVYNVIIKKLDGDKSYVVELNDGQASAKIDGEPVPSSRVKQTDGKIIILDESGNEVTAFPMVVAPKATGFWAEEAGDEPSVGFMFDEEAAFAVTQNPPPVMLGITMASPGDSVAEHFDLGEGQGIQIQSVIEGLPAAEAGLKPMDIIVRVQGADRATPEALRMVLRKKEPGDEIRVKVLRQGDTEERVIKLREYDAEKLGVTVQVEPRFGNLWSEGGNQWVTPEYPEQFWGEFEKSIDEHFGDRLKEHMSEHQIGEAKKAFEGALKHLKNVPGRHRLHVSPDTGRWLYLQGEDGENREFFAVPRSGAKADGSGDLDTEIAGLKRELAEVRRQRDDMARELKEIKDLLKQLAGDRQ